MDKKHTAKNTKTADHVTLFEHV